MFVEGKVKCVIATSAFGMGVDIPDIRYVIHVGFPYNMLDYIQQCGRGGRDGNGCKYKLYASFEDIEKTANMLMNKYLKMYPLSKCIKIRQRDRKEYIKTVEYCLENVNNNNREKIKKQFRSKLDEFRNRDISEDRYVQQRSFQMLINASADIKRRIRRKEITFYESVLADGIYSLWYNDFESFTPRRLIACITGNLDLRFHKKKSERVVELIDRLMVDGLVPIEKHTENNKTKYYFNEQAKKCIDAMLDAMKQEDKRGTLDFNKIIPMPQSLDVTSGSVEDEALTAYLAAIDPFAPAYGEEKVSPKEYSQKLNMVLEKCHIFSGQRTLEITPELIEQGKVYMGNIELHGCTTWYEWSLKHWDTKWNSYSGDLINDNQITFLTAWSRPENIIQRLSEMYPDLTIEHSWADEDFGYNCGKAKYAAGGEIECYIPEGGTDEARDLASDILGYEWEQEEEDELENE